MAPAPRLAHPVSTLREQITALEAAMTLALADPEEKPVHQLRTATRRIEAQLVLLDFLQQMPADRKLARKAGKALQRIRRAAGAVRDLDVHRNLLQTLAHQEPNPEVAGSAEHDAHRADRIETDVESLRQTLKHRRSREARDLVHLLRKEAEQLAPALEALLTALKPAEDLSLSADHLAEATRVWYRERLSSLPRGKQSADDLHTVRKAAKLARYLAESSPGNSTLAQAYESLQGVGGTWHDLLTLADIAKAELGRHAPLTEILRVQTRRALDAYRKRLKQSEKNPLEAPGSPSAATP